MHSSPSRFANTQHRLSHAASVGVETMRLYQPRSLLPVLEVAGAYRRYPVQLSESIRFVKRARDLGFSLAAISSSPDAHEAAHL